MNHSTDPRKGFTKIIKFLFVKCYDIHYANVLLERIYFKNIHFCPQIFKLEWWIIVRKLKYMKYLIFYNRVGCLFNCEDHFHFYFVIRNSKYESFHLFSFMSFPPLGISLPHSGPVSSWLDKLNGSRALRAVIAKVSVRFLVKLEFFSFFFQPLRSFIQLRGSFPPSNLS